MALDVEQRVRHQADVQVEVPGGRIPEPGSALPAHPDALTVRHAGRYGDVQGLSYRIWRALVHHGNFVIDLLAGVAHRLFEEYRYLDLDILAAGLESLPGAARASAGGAAEYRMEKLGEVRAERPEIVAGRGSPPGRRLEVLLVSPTVAAQFIVFRPTLLVFEDFPGLRHFLELVLRIFLGVEVRVILPREAAVGGLYFAGLGFRWHAEYVVIVLEFHLRAGMVSVFPIDTPSQRSIIHQGLRRVNGA